MTGEFLEMCYTPPAGAYLLGSRGPSWILHFFFFESAAAAANPINAWMTAPPQVVTFVPRWSAAGDDMDGRKSRGRYHISQNPNPTGAGEGKRKQASKQVSWSTWPQYGRSLAVPSTEESPGFVSVHRESAAAEEPCSKRAGWFAE